MALSITETELVQSTFGTKYRDSSEFFGMEPPHFSVWEEIPPSFLIEKYCEYVKIVLSFVGEFQP